nr:MAG TPA: DNA polymerase III subunit alpha [Caudoviricetes sp.]
MRPWYQRTWVIILAFIFFFPLGILFLVLRLMNPANKKKFDRMNPQILEKKAQNLTINSYSSYDNNFIDPDLDKIPTDGVKTVSANGSIFEVKAVLTDKQFIHYNTNLKQRHPGFYKVADFTVIDFETANMYPDSICQIGIAVVKNNKVVDIKSYNVRPPYDEFTNTKIHGISLTDVINEPIFAELWPEIKPYIENQLIAAYNLSFDISCLEATLANFQIPVPNYACFDILDSARTAFSLDNHKLKTVANFLGLTFKQHNAGDDARIAAEIQIAASDFIYRNTIFFKYDNKAAMDEAEAVISRGISIAEKVKQMYESYKEKPTEECGVILAEIEKAESYNCEDAYLYRVHGEIVERSGDLIKSLELYKKAFSLDSKVGVKRKISALEKQVQTIEEPSSR